MNFNPPHATITNWNKNGVHHTNVRVNGTRLPDMLQRNALPVHNNTLIPMNNPGVGIQMNALPVPVNGFSSEHVTNNHLPTPDGMEQAAPNVGMGYIQGGVNPTSRMIEIAGKASSSSIELLVSTGVRDITASEPILNPFSARTTAISIENPFSTGATITGIGGTVSAGGTNIGVGRPAVNFSISSGHGMKQVANSEFRPTENIGSEEDNTVSAKITSTGIANSVSSGVTSTPIGHPVYGRLTTTGIGGTVSGGVTVTGIRGPNSTGVSTTRFGTPVYGRLPTTVIAGPVSAGGTNTGISNTVSANGANIEIVSPAANIFTFTGHRGLQNDTYSSDSSQDIISEEDNSMDFDFSVSAEKTTGIAPSVSAGVTITGIGGPVSDGMTSTEIGYLLSTEVTATGIGTPVSAGVTTISGIGCLVSAGVAATGIRDPVFNSFLDSDEEESDNESDDDFPFSTGLNTGHVLINRGIQNDAFSYSTEENDEMKDSIQDDTITTVSKEDNVSTPEPEVTDDDHFPGRNGDLRLNDDREMSSDDVAGLWTGYHALGLKKSTPPGAREQSSPLLLTQETGSVHDETSSSGNKEDEDDDEDDGEDKIDSQQYDPERLKAFNMFVRLFVDENLDRIVPISKQPKEKIQAIIDSCTRQFPEFAERARKRIRTYLKSCRRNKRSRETNGAWDATRPTPAHLTSVQAEQILAQACENESHNAKRMRLGLEPVSQPLPLLPSSTVSTDSRPASMDHYSSPVVVSSDAATKPALSTTINATIKSEPPSLHSVETGLSLSPAFNPAATVGTKSTVSSVEAMAKSVNTTASIGTTVNGSATSSAAPTALYRPNFSQAFQRAATTGPYPNPLFPTPQFGSGGMISNGPTDLSMKTKPLLSHKLNTAEMAAVRQLITGYRESAAFLLRSADELEQLLLQQQ